MSELPCHPIAVHSSNFVRADYFRCEIALSDGRKFVGEGKTEAEAWNAAADACNAAPAGWPSPR